MSFLETQLSARIINPTTLIHRLEKKKIVLHSLRTDESTQSLTNTRHSHLSDFTESHQLILYPVFHTDANSDGTFTLQPTIYGTFFTSIVTGETTPTHSFAELRKFL
jgi:hypothetical protein